MKIQGHHIDVSFIFQVSPISFQHTEPAEQYNRNWFAYAGFKIRFKDGSTLEIEERRMGGFRVSDMKRAIKDVKQNIETLHRNLINESKHIQ